MGSILWPVAAVVMRTFIRLLMVVGGGGFLLTPAVWASCNYVGNMSFSGGSGSAVRFEQVGRVLLGGKVWMEDPRFPVGTYLGVSEGLVQAHRCSGFRDLPAREPVTLVYFPPANSLPIAKGWRIPTDNASLSVDIEFQDGWSYAGGIGLATSLVGVTTSGSLGSGGDNNVFVVRTRISLVKTAAFTSTQQRESSGVLRGLFEMGTLKYVNANNPNLASASVDRAEMPGPWPGDRTAYVGAPHCDIRPTLPGDINIGNTGQIAMVRLQPISADYFRGIGAVDQASQTKEIVLHCWGLPSTRPDLFFETRFPMSGADGVGMPTADSDIGVQVLLGDRPVRFGVGSPLALNMSKPVFGVFTPETLIPKQGFYCVANCPADMTTADWINGDAVEDNLFRVPISFKYFQTTAMRPGPRKFSVPFTVTVNVF